MLSANQARDLGDGLRRLRQRKGLTRYQAAEVCGMPHLVYAWLECGRLPHDDHEQAMARAWGALQMYHVARGA
jgi:transcriptional regulator with XRE-family HTH domain